MISPFSTVFSTHLGEVSTIFIKFEIFVYKLFQFGRVQNLLFRKGLTFVVGTLDYIMRKCWVPAFSLFFYNIFNFFFFFSVVKIHDCVMKGYCY